VLAVKKMKDKGALTLDDVTGWWETQIVDIAPGSIRIRGYAIEDLIGQVSFPAMIWLVLRGELPSQDQAQLFGAVLVSAVDHGPQAPSIAVARMAATCGLGLNGAIASGVNTLGDVHGGTGQQCMELLADAQARVAAGGGLESAAAEAIAAFREQHGEFIPGYGHRFHPIDPRTVRLSELVREAMRAGTVSGRYLLVGEAVQRALSKGKAKALPMNIDGITAVVLLELGFPSELGRGIFILSRSVGICAHAFEQSRMGERIKGPTPPASGFRYSGVAPRALPDAVKKSPP
jgi:citrate synthase